MLELLISTAIVGVLVGLLLPAVQAAREATRRTDCQNNLRQIGIALHSYHGTNGHFPRGGWWPPSEAELSWGAAILPGVEASSVFDLIDRNLPYTDPKNLPAGQTQLAVYLCPSVPRDPQLVRSVDLSGISTHLYARTHYAAVNGERGLRSLDAKNTPERGAMIFEKNISLKEIVDGASQTILIAEAPEGIHSLWFSVRNLLDQSEPINTPASIQAEQHVFADFGQEISSYHPKCALALFADGSVHVLSEELDNFTLAAICSRAGGEATDAF